MTTTFDDVADHYDDAFRDRWHHAEDAAVRRMIEPFITGADVLDVGCGTGLGLTMGTPRSYLGIDPSHEMIRRANRRWLTQTRPGADPPPRPVSFPVDFACCSAELLQPPAGVYDTVLCLWSWPYLDDAASCLKSWHRALRANGSVIVASWDERYRPTIPVPDHPQRVTDAAALAIRYGLVPWTLGGLRRGVWTRTLARALPPRIASRIVETGPHAPAWVMRLARPQIGQEPPGRFHHHDHGLRAPRRMSVATHTLRRPHLGWPEPPTCAPPHVARPGARRLIPVLDEDEQLVGWTTAPPLDVRPAALPGHSDRAVGGP